MKLSIKAGNTSESVNVFIQDSSSTTGAGLSGLAYNTANLAAYYSFTGANATATVITLATLGAVNSAWSSGGFIEIDATHMKGWYRLDLPNAVIAAANGRVVSVHLYGATNMAPCPLEIELTGWDNQDAVHGGMSALPNTACTTNASLITSGTGTDQLLVESGVVDANAVQWLDTAISAPATAGVPDVNVKNMNNVAATSITTINANIGETQPLNFTGTGASALVQVDVQDWLAHAVTVDANNAPNVSAKYWAGTAITATSIPVATAAGAAGGLLIAGSNAATTFATGSHFIGTVDTITTYTGNTVQTGDSFARLGAPAGASIAADLAEIEAETDLLLGGVTVTTNNDKTGYSLSQAFPANFAAMAITGGGAVLLDGTSPLTESYNKTNVTLAQGIYELLQVVGQFSIAATTLTFQKRDTSTVAGTFTLDSATSPTSRTRAT